MPSPIPSADPPSADREPLPSDSDGAPAVQTPEASPSGPGAPSGPPIHTTLPIDDEEMRCIVVNFIDRLDGRLNGMQDALDHADFQTLRSEAHWLKGSGGTVGFGDFTIPARELEFAAKDQDSQLALDILQQISSIRSRIVPPAPPGEPAEPSAAMPSNAAVDDHAPIECTLPLDDADYLAIVVDFLEQLDARLMGMLSMVQNQSFDELENEAHWLKGSGGTVGFPAFTEPALALIDASRRRSVRQCQKTLRDVLAVRQRLVVPQASAPTPAE